MIQSQLEQKKRFENLALKEERGSLKTKLLMIKKKKNISFQHRDTLVVLYQIHLHSRIQVEF